MPVGDLAPEVVKPCWSSLVAKEGSLGDMVGGMDFGTELSKITSNPGESKQFDQLLVRW